MNGSKRWLALLALWLGVALAPAAFAQTLLTEDFTGATSSATSGVGNWLFFNGACLTAGTSSVLTPPATTIPACTAVLNSYYTTTQDADQYLVGGYLGYLGSSTAPGSPSAQVADPVGNGALRFTNGRPYGNQQRGAIVSTNAYTTGSGIQVTFKTVTYGGTGADGISFYLMDGCVPVAGAILPTNCAANAIYPTGSANVPAIGATGGSLAYSCSDTNGPSSGTGVTYDGLTNGYLGLGIDEYGNFLNQGDNTATGYGFQPGRIGLRGAGAISWPALTNAYGTNPNNTSKPFYPAWLSATCGTGTFDSSTGTCGVCPTVANTSNTSGGVTTTTATTTVYGGGTCTNTTVTTVTTANCNSGYTYNTAASPTICGKCSSGTYQAVNQTGFPQGYCSKAKSGGSCSSGFTYNSTLGVCTSTSALTTQTPLSTGTAGTTTSTSTTTNAPTSTSAYTANTSAIQAAVQKTCSSGHLWNYATPSAPTDAGTATLTNDPNSPNPYNTANILDYAPIPGANTLVTQPIYNGSATTRAQGTPIFYQLKITHDGYLSLSYAYNGGSYQQVIANQNIQSSNGSLPAYVRFGFAGSTGGATNVHEIMCFKSAPATQSASSAGVNEKQSAKVDSGTFAYFAYYDQNNWVGRVTASALSSDPNTGVVSIASTPSWDASCVLTGVASGSTCLSTQVAGPTAAEAPASRVILTYNAGGVPFEWNNLSTAQQTSLSTGDATAAGSYRLSYLRGDRTNEINSAGTCSGGSSVCFRARTTVLGDIVDSSPTWVGAPQSPYTQTWKDKLFPSAATPENSGQSYSTFVTAQETRPNIVYVGSNDGMLHGFRSGANDSSGNFTTATTPNDGQEVLAYVPGSILLSAANGGACTSLSATGSVVQNIHGVTPGSGSTAACVNAALDYSSPQYGHNYFVDATAGTGDLYYSGAWHTWLVSGLGAGGAALFALDVTNPTSSYFTENGTAPANTVIGEWTSSNITCVGNSSCGQNLGQTFGTPIIRRLHDGRWAVIFGNGFNSASGDAGVFVMTVDSSGGKLFYYLSTSNTGSATNNGIAYVTSADLDGDHVTDYLYAGDLMGNVWRFDLTSSTETSWAVTPGPLFTAASGQPITTAVTVSAGATTAGGNTVIIAFGTGRRAQFTNAAAVSFPPSNATTTYTESIYGVWDWNMTNWDSKSATQYAALASPSGLSGPNSTITRTNLLSRSFVVNTTDHVTRDISGTTAVCWAGSSGCTGSAGQYGWYLDLVGALEQIIYNPQLLQGVFTVNSIVPANNQLLACSTNNDKGFTYAVSVLSGATVPNFFVSYHDTLAAGIETDAVGTSFPVTSSTGSIWLVSQTVTNQPILTQVNPGSNAKGKRLSWVQLR